MKKLRVRKLNDIGSALLTVVLVVSLLTILATTLLYITGMNFQIKQVDYQNKKTFYSGETALEEIRAGLMKDASEAAMEAYNEVAAEYVSLGVADARTLKYNTLFAQKLQESWNDAGKLPTYGDNWDVFLSSYFSNPPTAVLTFDSAYDLNLDGHLSVAEANAAGAFVVDETNGEIRIKGLQITYTNDSGVTTMIATDLLVAAPAIDWSAEKSLTALNGVDPATAAYVNVTDASGCVRYENWKKE